MRCQTCSTPIPLYAKFCPKCGRAAPSANAGPAPLPRAAGALPPTAPLPRSGKIFITALVLGLALLLAGWLLPNFGVLMGGLVLLGVVVVVVVVGHHVS